jgi:hypothetical protein
VISWDGTIHIYVPSKLKSSLFPYNTVSPITAVKIEHESDTNNTSPDEARVKTGKEPVNRTGALNAGSITAPNKNNTRPTGSQIRFLRRNLIISP